MELTDRDQKGGQHGFRLPDWAFLEGFTLLVCFYFAELYFSRSRIQGAGTPDDLANFVAAIPFQGRILIPFLVHYLSMIVGLSYNVLYEVIMVASLYVSLRALRPVFQRLLGWTPLVACLGSFAFLFPLFCNYLMFQSYMFVSDLGAIAFYLVGLYCILEGRWRDLLLIVFFGAINRETIGILIPTLLLLRYDSIPIRKLLSLAAGLTIIFLGVRAGIGVLLSHQHGDVMAYHLQDNLSYIAGALLLDPGLLYHFIFVFGGLHIVSAFVVFKCPPTVRRMFLLSILFLLPMSFVALFVEIRIFNEAILGFCLPAFYMAAQGIRRMYSTSAPAITPLD